MNIKICLFTNITININYECKKDEGYINMNV